MYRKIFGPPHPDYSWDSRVLLSIIPGAVGRKSVHRLLLATATEITSSLNVPSSSAYTQLHICSMSSQSVTMPCSIGYLIFSSPRNSCARLPMNTSPSNAPAMTRICFGRPTLCSNVRRYGLVSENGPNREDAQRRKETFWMILTSKSRFNSPRALRIKGNRYYAISRRLNTANIINDNRLVCENVVKLCRHGCSQAMSQRI
jgi:hypothetical protein